MSKLLSITEKFNALLDGDGVTPADLADKELMRKATVKYLDVALGNIRQQHDATPEETLERIHAFHAFTVFSLQSDPSLTSFIGSMLKKRFMAETDERFLDHMGGSIQPLVGAFPDLAPFIADTMAQKWIGMTTNPATMHTAQALSAVCHAANRHELFIDACLHKMCAEKGAFLSAGSPYFDNHLNLCREGYEDLVEKILKLYDAKQAGIPGNYADQYAAILPPMMKPVDVASAPEIQLFCRRV